MTINGIPDHILEEIELRLLGADCRPWSVSPPETVDHAGRRFIVRASRKFIKKAVRSAHQKAIQDGHSKAAHEVEENDPRNELLVDPKQIQRSLALFYAGEPTTVEMLEFVAHAPHDIERLLQEVRTNRKMLALAIESRDKAISELQQFKVAASRAESKIVDMRRAWREFHKEMGSV